MKMIIFRVCLLGCFSLLKFDEVIVVLLLLICYGGNRKAQHDEHIMVLKALRCPKAEWGRSDAYAPKAASFSKRGGGGGGGPPPIKTKEKRDKKKYLFEMISSVW
jgi:hypothetical protein